MWTHNVVHKCTSYSNLLSSVSDVAMKVVIYQNQNELNLDPFIKGLSSYSIQVPVGDKVQLECLSTHQLCEGQWMRDDANVSEIITGTLVGLDEITEEDEGTYTCQTQQLCTSQKISVVIDVIKTGELLSYGSPFMTRKRKNVFPTICICSLILVKTHFQYLLSCFVQSWPHLNTFFFRVMSRAN